MDGWKLDQQNHFELVGDLRFGEAFGVEPLGHLLRVGVRGQRDLTVGRSLPADLSHGRLVFIGRDHHQQLTVHLIHLCNVRSGTMQSVGRVSLQKLIKKNSYVNH